MDWLKLLLLFLFFYFVFGGSKENLRMQGSHDLRGDVPIARYPVGPWNIGSSDPKQRRIMTIGYEEDY